MKAKKVISIINVMQIIILLISLYLIFTLNILNILIKVIIGAFILIIGINIITNVNKLKKKQKYVKAGFLSFAFLIIFGVILISFNYIDKVDVLFNQITKDTSMDVNSSFFVLKNSQIKNIKGLANKKIGLLNNENDYEGYILPQKALKEAKIEANISYEVSYLSLITHLIDNTYQAIVLPNDYKDRFEFDEPLLNAFKDFIPIHEMSDKILIPSSKNKTSFDNTNPFNIVLMGTDSALAKHHHNYDVIVLLTFNPKTNDLVITSVYRAMGMPSKCIGGIDLVNHNGWKGWGPNCLKQTLEDFFDIEINHYIMIDFQGFVDMINILDGITVDVPKKFCEQDSKRRFGKYEICLKAGEQLLNGEQALAFARHRQSYAGEGGIVRSKNHVAVIKAIGKKILNVDILFKFNELLKIVQNNMETDMNKDQLYNLYEMGLKVVKNNDYNFNKINITSLNTEGSSGTYYSPAMNTAVGMSIMYEQSYQNIYNTLQTVLYNKPPKPTYYSIDLSKDPHFIPKKILSNITDKINDPRVMINLVGQTINEVEAFENKYLNFQIKKEYEFSETVPLGKVISQSIKAGESLGSRSKMTVVISLGQSPIQPSDNNKDKDKDKDTLPDILLPQPNDKDEDDEEN